MSIDWSPLRSELAAWRATGEAPTFWWRDDDAIAVTPALETLVRLATDVQVPVHLAVIPKDADATLAKFCLQDPLLVPLVHGWTHKNRAPLWKKTSEFGTPRADLVDDAKLGIDRIASLFEGGFVPCFVPPWNRIAAELIPALPGLGYTCLSTYTPRAARLAAPGLVQINTHIDPIFWRGGRGLVPAERLISETVTLLQDRRLGRIDRAEPLGFLTHHLVHTDAIWDFTRLFLAELREGGGEPVNLLDLRDDLP